MFAGPRGFTGRDRLSTANNAIYAEYTEATLEPDTHGG